MSPQPPQGARFVVTGGAGFIGSAFVRLALQRGWAAQVHVLDALTYAGNLANLQPVRNHPGFSFQRGDVACPDDVARALEGDSEAVFHFAAESHVDRSIDSAAAFVRTNVVGTQVLLDGCRRAAVRRLCHVSTDEVYGALPLDDGPGFSEQTPLCPTSPYAASKAAADLMVLAAHRTHGLDAVVTRCSNNYGPYQFPEKFIPLFITNAMDGLPVPLYGDGKNVRDWIHVDDHCLGLYQAYRHGRPGAVYNLGGECERDNLTVAHHILTLTGRGRDLLRPVADRLAHDRRYAIDTGRARAELDFVPGPPIEQRLAPLARWYAEQRPWWEAIKAGAYRDYYARQYGDADNDGDADDPGPRGGDALRAAAALD